MPEHPPCGGYCLGGQFGGSLTDDGLVFLLHDAEFHQQLFQLFHLYRGRDYEVGVVDDLGGELTIFVGLLVLRIVFNDGHAADFAMLHGVVTRHEVDHGGAQAGSQGHDQFVFAVGVTRVADQASQTDTAGVRVLHDTLGDVVGSVHGHHFARTDDVDFLSLVFTDRHGEATANHVTEHVVEYEVEVFVIGAFFFQEVDGGDDAAAGTADAGFRATGFDALDAAEADGEHVFQFEVLDGAGFGSQVHHGGLSLAMQDQAGRVGFRVAANDHHFLAGFGQGRHQILRGGGFADTALAVDGALTEFCHGVISLVCQSICEGIIESRTSPFARCVPGRLTDCKRLNIQ